MNRFALALLLVPSICSAEVKFATLPTSAKAATKLDIERAGCKIRSTLPSYCSGVNTDQGVITCDHSIQGSLAAGAAIYVECEGEKSVATVIYRDTQSDIAILRPAWNRDHVKLELEPNRPRGGDKVRTLSRQRNGNIGSEEAIVTGGSFDGKILIDLASFGGMSGGGVVNADGKLIGIISGNVAIEPFQGLVIPVRELPSR